MDMRETMINLDHEQYDLCIKEIMKSDMSISAQHKIKALLKTALMRADQARNLGLIPKKSSSGP